MCKSHVAKIRGGPESLSDVIMWIPSNPQIRPSNGLLAGCSGTWMPYLATTNGQHQVATPSPFECCIIYHGPKTFVHYKLAPITTAAT